MTALLHHRLRLARRGLVYAVAITLVLMALVVAVVSQLLPLAERHPDHVAAWLSDRLGRPVAFDHLETEWTRRGPLLRLDALRVGEGDKAIRIGDAEMLISQYAGLLPGRSFTVLRLHGLDLTLERSDDGRWDVRGLPGEQQGGGDPFESLEGLGELQVIDGKLTVLAPQLQIRAHLPKVDIRLQVDSDRVRAGMRAWIQVGKSPLLAVADFGRERGNGRAYVGTKQADLEVWAPLLHLAGVSTESGHGRGEAWARLREHRIVAVTLDTLLDDVTLRGTALDDGTVPRVRFGQLEARADWRMTPEGWRLDAPRLRLRSADKDKQQDDAIRLDGLAVAGGMRFAGMAEQVDIAPLLAVAALSDRMTPGLRHWIVAAKPQGQGSHLRFSTSRDGRMRAEGRIDDVGFDQIGDAPGLHGLAGTLQGDGEGFALAFDDDALLRFDWPRGFDVSHAAHLRGTLAGWREGAGWRVGTSDLHIAGDDFGVRFRGGLWFQGDGTRPWIDLAATIDPTRMSVAKGFWIHHMMSPTTIDWLDKALVAGRIENGRALVSGDLDNWPFNNHDGRFEARARIRDATLKFNPDWPVAEHLDAEVGFVGNGFDVHGKAVLAGVGVRAFDAGIPDFAKPELTVHAQGGGDASRLLGLVRKSPLQKQYGETLDNLDAGGLASVTFDLDQPLHDGRTGKLGGTVSLADVKLSEKRWDLSFTGVRGRARYDSDGFDADQLAVQLDNRSGKLSLRAGGHVRDPKQGFEAQLDTVITAQELLARAPQMGWLQPYINGQSPWSVMVTIPKAGSTAPSRNATASTAQPARLRLRSSLVGTALTLPAPLDKPASANLTTTVDASLPLDEGEIAVVFGQRLALRAHSGDRGTGVRVALGSDRVAQAPPTSGLIATGHTDRLDAIDWATLSTGSRGSTDQTSAGQGGARSGGVPLRNIDITASHLRLLGADFPNIRVRAAPEATATRLQFDGDALAGTVRLPNADGAAIGGKLQRLYWQPAKAGDATTKPGNPAAIGKADDTIGPSKVPPLELGVDDLRLGDARFGTASLRTRPTAAGMHVDQFQIRGPGQKIDVSGDWTGRNAATRTRLGIRIASEDFGALLAGFGYGGQLLRGNGTATLDAGWAGSPAAFKLGALDGTLKLDVRDGQLAEVEPGAGRVLGLLSIAQLPRRLTLDFRDFFSKGFAFDKMTGDVGLGGGRASTENLVIDGPAAKIRISGAADLRAQRFDQTIEVLPKAGNLLTAVGAIAGGPIGAAIGAAANAVLRKPLGQLAAKTYRVTGPWKEPKVEVIGHEQSRTQNTQPTTPPG